jgi:hypothetical protein
MAIHIINICLDKIDEDRIYINEQTGKRWLGLVLYESTNPPAGLGNIQVLINPTKEERDNGVTGKPIGWGRTIANKKKQ